MSEDKILNLISRAKYRGIWQDWFGLGILKSDCGVCITALHEADPAIKRRHWAQVGECRSLV